MGGHDPHTDLVPDLPMHQVFLHLESLKRGLLHGALQQRSRPAQQGLEGRVLPVGRLSQPERRQGQRAWEWEAQGPAALPLRGVSASYLPFHSALTTGPSQPGGWIPAREGGCFSRFRCLENHCPEASPCPSLPDCTKRTKHLGSYPPSRTGLPVEF